MCSPHLTPFMHTQGGPISPRPITIHEPPRLYKCLDVTSVHDSSLPCLSCPCWLSPVWFLHIGGLSPPLLGDPLIAEPSKPTDPPPIPTTSHGKEKLCTWRSLQGRTNLAQERRRETAIQIQATGITMGGLLAANQCQPQLLSPGWCRGRV